MIRNGILIVPLPAIALRLLKRFASCRKTVIENKKGIAMHDHEFMALYFTENVRYLETANSRIELPPRAAVLVLTGAKHGWFGIQEGHECAIVAHFHKGHGAHTLTAH